MRAKPVLRWKSLFGIRYCVRQIVLASENNMHRCQVFLPIIALGFILGCAGSPNLGDSMKSHGQAAEHLGKQWSQGEKMLKQGEKLQKQSSKLSQQAEQKQSKGEDLIARGKELMKQSEASFENQFPNGKPAEPETPAQ